MNKKWNEKSTFEKMLDIISGIALCVWLTFEMLERKNMCDFAGFVNCISICVICICQSISFWNIKRSLSYVAIFGVVCMISVIVLKILWNV